MPRYTPESDPDHTPVDYHAATLRIRKLGLAPNSRALQVATDLVRTQRTQCSAASAANELAFLLAWCKKEGIEPLRASVRDMEIYAAGLANYAMGTQYLRLLWARSFFTRAIRYKFLRENPVEMARGLKRTPERLTPSLTKLQAEELLAGCVAEFDNRRLALGAKRDYATLTLMLRLCFRVTETLNLRWSRFREIEGRIIVSFIGKGRKPAHLPVPADVWQTLNSWKRAYEKATGTVLGPNDPVLLPVSTRDLLAARGRKGQSPLPRLTRHPVYWIVVSRLRAIGVMGERYSPHCLRATGAVLSYRAGSSLPEVQRLLRHSSVQTTMRYLESILQDAVDAAVDRIQLDVPEWVEESDPAASEGPGVEAAS